MKIIHQNGYSVDELAMYRLTIYKNLVDCAKALVMALQQFDIEPDISTNRVSGGAPKGGGFGIYAFVLRIMRALSWSSRLTLIRILLWIQSLQRLLYRYGEILVFRG
jgi:hypothetical protein